ncbi:prolyl aminopeptidase [Castilleja foliolosa]|uniref:Prolyl aminopeptidase n=1 Tax=Castilleja foliolosa TaxID=1961234 RepID=A0ABD3BZ11_9LAMI
MSEARPSTQFHQVHEGRRPVFLSLFIHNGGFLGLKRWSRVSRGGIEIQHTPSHSGPSFQNPEPKWIRVADLRPMSSHGDDHLDKQQVVDRVLDVIKSSKSRPLQGAEIVELITQLEANNPTPAPTEALPLLNGKWILAIKFDEGVIGTTQLTDSIVLPEDVEFLGQKIDLTPFRGLLDSVQDTASSVARTITSQPPLKFSISNRCAESWLLTTYLDDELRISRSDGGSIFVLIKEGSSLLTP